MASREATAVKAKPKRKTASKTTATKKSAAAKSEAADATEAVVAPKVKAAPKRRTKAKAESRTRIYWAVFNQNLKRVAVFEFDQKGEAEKRAAKLTSDSGEDHFIQKLKVAAA